MTLPRELDADVGAARHVAQGHAPTSPATARDRPPPPSETIKVDFCILGSGIAARLVALKAAETGASVALIVPPTGSDGAAGGLTGLFSAPLALIEAANLHHAARITDALRLRDDADDADAPRLSGEGLVRHVHHVGEALAARTADPRLRALRVSILTGAAHFEDHRSVRCGEVRIAARRFVVEPAIAWDIPPIPGINEIDYLTPDRPLIASRPVERLVVIGLSDAGLALAQAHRRLGAEVTLLPSPHDDPRHADDEIIRLALMGLVLDGVAVHRNATVNRIEARGREAAVHAATAEGALRLDPAQVLLAPRLRAHFADRGWAAAQITLDGGTPVIDAALRTSNRRIHVIGAGVVTDTFSFHLERDADFIVDALRHGRMPRDIVPVRIVPTTPEIAVVGLDEAAARRACGRINVLRTSNAHHVARLARHRGLASPPGELKVIAARRGRIVGCAIVGDGAGDIAGLWALAIARRLRLDDVGGLSFPDIARHSLTRRATRLETAGWPLGGSLLLRLARLWRKIRG